MLKGSFNALTMDCKGKQRLSLLSGDAKGYLACLDMMRKMHNKALICDIANALP